MKNFPTPITKKALSQRIQAAKEGDGCFLLETVCDIPSAKEAPGFLDRIDAHLLEDLTKAFEKMKSDFTWKGFIALDVYGTIQCKEILPSERGFVFKEDVKLYNFVRICKAIVGITQADLYPIFISHIKISPNQLFNVTHLFRELVKMGLYVYITTFILKGKGFAMKRFVTKEKPEFITESGMLIDDRLDHREDAVAHGFGGEEIKAHAMTISDMMNKVMLFGVTLDSFKK